MHQSAYRLASYHLGSLEIKPAMTLAPMSGVTSAPFRRLIKELNPGCVGMVMTEFVSSEALTRMVPRSLDMIRLFPDERPAGIQIFGYDVERMRDAAVIAQEAGADIVDINCGCPAPKVVRRGGGCELMRQPDHLEKILSAVRKVVTVPLTLKMRSGWDSDSLNSLEIAKIAEQCGVEAIAIHGRTRVQLYRGTADWDVVHRIAEQVSIPVLGSGDVVDFPSAMNRLVGPSGKSLAGIMIGRGALLNPFIFSDIVAGLPYRKHIEAPVALRVLERYAFLLEQQFQPRGCIGRMKQLVSQMARGHTWRKDMCRADTWEMQKDILRRLRETCYEGRYAESGAEGQGNLAQLC